jgi:hypothetical protein
VLNDAPVSPSNVGEGSMPDYGSLSEAAIANVGDGKSWAGQSDDPFFLDLRVFDLLYGGDLSEAGDDTLAGFNVNTVVLQVAQDDLADKGDAQANPIVGMWSTTDRRKPNGDWVQVSRLGMPLVNEVVIPVSKKDRFNRSNPSNDGQFLSHVQDPELPHLLNAVYGLPVPDSDPAADGIQRADLISVFLTGVEGLNMPDGVTPSEQLRLNMSIAPCTAACSDLGVLGGDLAGFPNGRRLTDDIIDVSLQAVAGELLGTPSELADGVGQNDVAFRDSFPYVALPHSGSDDAPH